MMNSFSNCIINRPFNENYKFKPGNCFISIENKNKNNINNINQRNKLKLKNYLTLNLYNNFENKDSILSPAIYQTIKSENKRITKIRLLKENSRNLINSANESKEKQNKNSFIKRQETFKGKIIYTNKTNKSIHHTVVNKKVKKLNNSKSQCFTENNYNISNNKIIIPIYQSLFGENKQNNENNFITNNNENVFKDKNGKIKINLSQINNEINKNDTKIINEINNKSLLNNGKNIKYRNKKINPKISDKNYIIKEGITEFKKIFNKNIYELTFNNNKINKTQNLNKSENSSYKNSNRIKNIKKFLSLKKYKNKKFISAIPSISIFPIKIIDILNAIIKKRKQNIWESFKYNILKIRDYKYNAFDRKSLKHNNFQNKKIFLEEQLLNNNKNKHIIKFWNINIVFRKNVIF